MWSKGVSDYDSGVCCFKESGGGVMDNMLDYLSRDCKIDPCFFDLLNGIWKPRSWSLYDLIAGWTIDINPIALRMAILSAKGLNTSSLTHITISVSMEK